MTVWAERFVKALDSHQGARVVALMASEFRWEDLGAGLLFDNADVLAAFIAGFRLYMKTSNEQSSGNGPPRRYFRIGSNKFPTSTAGAIPPSELFHCLAAPRQKMLMPK